MDSAERVLLDRLFCLVAGGQFVPARYGNKPRDECRKDFAHWYKGRIAPEKGEGVNAARALVGAAAGRCAAAELLIDRLAALKARINGVPVLDGGLAHSPAEQNHFIVDAAGEVEEAGIEILYLDPDGIDLGNALANVLQMLFNFGPLPGDTLGVHAHPAGENDLLRQAVETRLDRLSGTPALHGAPEQELNRGEERLCFVDSKGFHRADPFSYRIRRECVIVLASQFAARPATADSFVPPAAMRA